MPNLIGSNRFSYAIFEGVKAVDITTDQILAYILQRQEEGAENGTINLELAALKRMFHLSLKVSYSMTAHSWQQDSLD
ncbi:MAG: hypothetical protein HYS21_12585 [Deltaproteobacteria bacterium]|nr:hypothetical protein [Deltaproteobacteria bacterium]